MCPAPCFYSPVYLVRAALFGEGLGFRGHFIHMKKNNFKKAAGAYLALKGKS